MGRIVRDRRRRISRHRRRKRRHARPAGDHRSQHEHLRLLATATCCRPSTQLTADNAQGEYYLTDCPGVLKAAGKSVLALPVLQPCESLSINTLEDLAVVEAEMKKLLSK